MNNSTWHKEHIERLTAQRGDKAESVSRSGVRIIYSQEKHMRRQTRTDRNGNTAQTLGTQHKTIITLTHSFQFPPVAVIEPDTPLFILELK